MDKDKIGQNCKQLFKCGQRNEFVGISQISFSFIMMTMRTCTSRKTNHWHILLDSCKKLKSNKSFEDPNLLHVHVCHWKQHFKRFNNKAFIKSISREHFDRIKENPSVLLWWLINSQSQIILCTSIWNHYQLF